MKRAPDREHRQNTPFFDGLGKEQFLHWTKRLRSVVLPIVHDSDAADDICQEVWVRYIRYRPDDTNLSGWLTTVAKRLALNYRASGAVRFRAATQPEDLGLPSNDPAPDAVLHRQDRTDRIEQILQRLNPRHSRVLKLCDHLGYSYAEAADELELSESAVTSLLFRARKAFKREYLLAAAPPWLRAVAEAGSVDSILDGIDPFSPDLELTEEIELLAHNLFGDIAPKWDRIRRRTIPHLLDDALTHHAELQPGDWALDAGTGTGAVALNVARRVKRVVGVDRSMPMLKIASERAAEKASGNVFMEYGDLNRLALKEGSFDVAFCSLVLRHVQHPERVVSSLAGRLRRGGRLVICDRLQKGDSAGDAGLNPTQLQVWSRQAGLGDMRLNRLNDERKDQYFIAVARKS